MLEKLVTAKKRSPRVCVWRYQNPAERFTESEAVVNERHC
jgi:hypothetical protein